MPQSLKKSVAEQGLMPNTSASHASCMGPRETGKVLAKRRGQNGERYPKKENKPAPFHLHPSPVPLRPPALLSLGTFTREHHTIYSKPEIRTVLMKDAIQLFHTCMQCSCDPTSRGRNKCNFVFVYGEWAP